MGCWSESCALSGLEIMMGEEDVYVALMTPSKYGKNEWDIVVPPVKGTYDDYGGIDLTEDVPYYNLVKGDNWRPREDGRGQPVYFNGAVFDSLASLEREFAYNGRTIGEAFAYHVSELMEDAKEVDDLVQELGSEVAKALADIKMSRVFRNDGPLEDAVHLFRNVPREEFIKLYKRAFILSCAQRELRKLVVPGVSGPQHNGETALKQFYTTVNNILDERIERFRKEYGEDEDV